VTKVAPGTWRRLIWQKYTEVADKPACLHRQGGYINGRRNPDDNDSRCHRPRTVPPCSSRTDGRRTFGSSLPYASYCKDGRQGNLCAVSEIDRCPGGLRRRSEPAWLLGSRVWIPLRAWIFVSCLLCVFQVAASAMISALVRRRPTRCVWIWVWSRNLDNEAA